jgi:ParB family transcriptional regulator, chromosome partitioning protein
MSSASTIDGAANRAQEGAAARGRRRFTVDELFADHRPQAVGVSELPTAKEIRLERIAPDPHQPRRTFDAAKLGELSASIQIEGVLQPIVVRYDDESDTYVIVHGERRWRAAQEAGLAVIPAIVRDVPEHRRLIQQLMENIVRDDLNAVDRAAALRALKRQLGDAPWDNVAEAVGIRRSRLFQLLGTEKLPETIQADIRAGRLSEKQSRALQGLTPGQQEALRDVIVDDELPVDVAMRLARQLRAAKLPDDRAIAAEAIAELRAAQPCDEELTVDSGALLAVIADAAGGSRAARQALNKAADDAGAPPYDANRLQAEVFALARSLARTPSEELLPGSPAYLALATLASTLEELLRARG